MMRPRREEAQSMIQRLREMGIVLEADSENWTVYFVGNFALHPMAGDLAFPLKADIITVLTGSTIDAELDA